MPLKKFGKTDIIRNTIVSYPKVNFFIYNGNVYYNNKPDQDGRFSKVYSSEVGSVNLYEYNIDKLAGSNDFIYPYITNQHIVNTQIKKFAISKAELASDTADQWQAIPSTYGDLSFDVELGTGTNPATGDTFSTSPVYPHFYALKNRLNFLGQKSQHYLVSSSYGDKATQTINLISIPSIVYGSRINPGSVSLRWYLTGSLIGELQDTKENGELIQVGPAGSTGLGDVAGVVLYNEGMLLLTGSWNLSSETIGLTVGGSATNPKWTLYGAGAKDGVSSAAAPAGYVSASFDMSFEGQTDTYVYYCR